MIKLTWPFKKKSADSAPDAVAHTADVIEGASVAELEQTAQPLGEASPLWALEGTDPLSQPDASAEPSTEAHVVTAQSVVPADTEQPAEEESVRRVSEAVPEPLVYEQAAVPAASRWSRLTQRLRKASPRIEVTEPVLGDTPDTEPELLAPELSLNLEQPGVSRLARLKETLYAQTLGRLATTEDDHGTLPIRVLIGYLPEVSERDAREYAQGIAEKHFEQMSLAHFDAYPYARGFAFEAHEGGNGRAYLPAILEYFEEQGPFQMGEFHSVVIRTGTRLVEVQRLREGLASILLPEAAEIEPTHWLKGSRKMIPGLNQRNAFFKAGAVLLGTGLFAVLLSGFLFRFQTFEEAPAPKVEHISAADLPRAQWTRIEALPPNSYVRSLRFKNNKWEAPEIVTDTPTPDATAAMPGNPAAPDAPKPTP